MSKPKRLTYSPLAWDTHPIDLVRQEQGWGPFKGPYQPLDYLDPATNMGGGISTGYNLDAFKIDHAPGYHDITLFSDPSTDRVNAILQSIQNDSVKKPGAVYSNTIANGFDTLRSRFTSGG